MYCHGGGEINRRKDGRDVSSVNTVVVVMVAVLVAEAVKATVVAAAASIAVMQTINSGASHCCGSSSSFYSSGGTNGMERLVTGVTAVMLVTETAGAMEAVVLVAGAVQG